RVIAVVGAALQKNLNVLANERNLRGDIRGDSRRPVTLLIPGQQVARKAQAKSDSKQCQPEPPVQLPRRQMSAGDHYLQHVQGDQYDQRLRAEMMNTADQPAKIHLILDVVDAGPGAGVAGAVRRHEQDASDELQHEDKSEGAAPDIAPLGAARNVFEQQRIDQLPMTDTVIQPVEKSLTHAQSLVSSSDDCRLQ